ncbi:MAG TPA: hypothetical protein VH253_15145 [Phycisphaerae bacterium]|nr:hypothetical protein [Phycisphaerae bacterium]
MAALLPESAAINRSAATLEGRMEWKKVPAKGAVYLLMGCEEEGVAGEEKPLLLATVGDLRSALKRRLDDGAAAVAAAEESVEAGAAGHTRKIPYHRLCTRVAYRVVHSPFAANWAYLGAARALHPTNYRELLSFQPTWWVMVNPRDAFPRLRPAQAVGQSGGALYAGPIRDRSAAGRLIDAVEDLFDLCREYPTLQLAPHGRACAYKEMGKCPAPCDGSVQMAWYHRQIGAAWAFVTDPAARQRWTEEQEAAMREAAARLEFERAGRIKSRIGRGGFLDEGGRGGPYAWLGRLEEFSFVCVQPGRGRRVAEVYAVHGGEVIALGEVEKKHVQAAAGELAGRIGDITRAEIRAPLGDGAIDGAALLAHHLFRKDPGVYVRSATLTADGGETLRELLEAFFAAPAPPAVSVSEGMAGAEATP